MQYYNTKTKKLYILDKENCLKHNGKYFPVLKPINGRGSEFIGLVLMTNNKDWQVVKNGLKK